MNIYFLIIILLNVTQIFGNNLTDNACYNTSYDVGAFMIAMLFTKLNKILHENTELNRQLVDLNKRLNERRAFFKAEMYNSTIQIQDLNEKQKQLNADMAKTTKLKRESAPWTVIQRRQDGSVDFYRDWIDYKFGFGLPSGELFIGLERLHEMTAKGPPQQLLITLQDHENNTRYAKYDEFQIGNETEKYVLKKIGKYSGNAGDSLSCHEGMKFSTKDQDNDTYPEGNCAENNRNAWWYLNCLYSQLNGMYSTNHRYGGSISWDEWHGAYYSLKYAEMKIRPLP